jgi:predicted metal-dependent phosphoesterase TrpH
MKANLIEADLHIHTTASDGTWSPEEAIRSARAAGLRAVAIADHDTMDGVHAAQQAGEREGIEVLAAVEINTDFRETQFHVLGYLFQDATERMAVQLRRIREARLDRAAQMVSKLQALNIPITLEEVVNEAGEGSVGRPHVARVLQKKGVVNEIQEAFDRFILPGRPAFVERYKLTPTEAVRLIRESGGIPVMAHPGLTRQDDYLPSLIAAGLVGLEVYHCHHTAPMSHHYLKLAKELGLLVTGGSDSHGPHSGRPIPLGIYGVSYEQVSALKRAGERVG